MDLRKAFYQILLSKGLHSLFASRLIYPSGETQAVQYTALPMGWSWSPWLLDAFLLPLEIAWSTQTFFRAVRYVDDILVVANNPHELARAVHLVLETLYTAGWQVNPEKTYLVAASRLPFLGICVDFDVAAVRAAEEHVTRTATIVVSLLSSRRADRTVLEKLVGKLHWLASICPLYHLLIRESQAALETASYYEEAPLAEEVLDELLSWNNTLFHDVRSWWPVAVDLRPKWLFKSDASDVGGGWVLVAQPEHSTTTLGPRSIPLPPGMSAVASGVRELWTTSCCLNEAIASGLREGDHVEIVVDATNVRDSMAGRSRSADMIREIKEIIKTRRSAPRFAFSIRWVPRELNQDADDASKAISYSDSRLEESVLQSLSVWAHMPNGPLVDYFASRGNARAPLFVSRFPDIAAIGTDGITFPPLPGAYAFPPFALVKTFCTSTLRTWLTARTPFLAVLPVRSVLAYAPWVDWNHVTVLPPNLKVVIPPPYDTPPVPSLLQLLAIRSNTP